jgi:8-oxo-dGTP diphosphatase
VSAGSEAGPEPRVGVGVLVRRGERTLLLKRHGSHGAGTWSSPGGHLDFGEDPGACARRETEEECGLVLGDIQFVGLTNDVFDDRRHYITIWFAAESTMGDAWLAAPDEMSEFGWFRLDELPEPLFPPLRRLLDGRLLGPGRPRES